MTIFSGQIAGSKLTLFFSIFWNLPNSIPLRYIWAQSIYRSGLWSRLKVSFVESSEKREKELPQRRDIRIACNVTKVGPQNNPADWLVLDRKVHFLFLLQFIMRQKPLRPPDPQQHFEFNFLIFIQQVNREAKTWEISHFNFAGEVKVCLP